MKNLLLVILILGIAAFISCTEDEDVIEPGPHEVWMKDNVFFPDSITIQEGSTITWTNKDETDHTVSAVDGDFDSGIIGPGETFKHTFDQQGEVLYECIFHSEMKGRIVVIF